MPAILVYCDTLGAPSQAFVERQYCGFRELTPIYVGTKRGQRPPRDAVAFAAPGLPGWTTRFAFRQWGNIPPKLDRLIRDRNPCLVHAQFGLGGALALPIAHSAQVPLAVTFHGGDATKEKHYRDRPLIPTIFQRRRVKLAESACAIFCVSRFVRDKLIARGFPEAKLQVHYLGIEIPESAVLTPPEPSNRVLFVGRLVEKKGVDTLIDAMARIRSTNPSLELVVFGDGPLRRSLERRAARAGIAAHFEGWRGPAEIRKAMRQALLLAVPSRIAAGGDSEGLPTVVMEAMTLGLPVVATRHAGIPEIVSDMTTGLLVPEADPDALARAIQTLSDDPDLARRLRDEAYADVRARFDARQQSELLERRLLQLAGFQAGASTI